MWRLIAWGLLSVFCLIADDSREQFFETHVRPLLVERCYSCHAEVRTSGLRVDSRDALLRGGNRGPALVPGSPEKSLLLTAIRHDDSKLRMPPQGRLSNEQVAAIESWIRDGALWPEVKAGARRIDRIITAEDRNFWSLRPLSDVGGTIDSLVHARLVRQGLQANPPAGRRTLLRRLSFDLTGLPPTPDEVAQFLADSSSRAVERVVDRLLASAQFGERWARHWLDVARYGEEDYTGTAPRFYPNAWRYRDWVIKAFNDDLPYDQFIKAQIAADLMGSNENLIGGLGLFGFGPWYYSISQPQQARADELYDRVDMITRGFLGLTGACARCHDHKYDPISMHDYYALAGVFANSKYEEYPLATPAEVKLHKEIQASIKAQEKKIERFLETQREQLAEMFAHRIADAMIAVALDRSETDVDIDCELLGRWRKYLKKPEEEFPYLNAWYMAVQRKAPESELRAIAQSFEDLVIKTAALKKELDAETLAAKNAAIANEPKRRKVILPGGYDSDADFNPGADVPVRALDRDRTLLWRRFFLGKDALLRFEDNRIERFLDKPRQQHLAILRGKLDRLRKTSPPPYGFYQGLAEHEERIDLPMNVRGNPFESGEPVPARFLAVLSKESAASWTTGSGRLQLAEAIVNSPITARVIANRIWMHLVGEGIVRTPSNLGRSGARPSNPELLEYLSSRLAKQRWSLKALIREIVLSQTYQASSDASAANEKIDAGNTLFWRANRRRLDAEALRDAILAVTGDLDRLSGGESAPLSDTFRRRTIYARVGRFKQDETLALFDFPSASVSVERRAVTNVPLQKLYMLNSPFVLRQAQILAKRMDELGIAGVYDLLFARPAQQTEIRLAEEFLQGAGSKGKERYAQVLLDSNEFVFID